jgi:hypothetical protein
LKGDAYITETGLTSFFRRQVDYGEGQASVGHVLADQKQMPDGWYFRLADADRTFVLGPGNNCLPDGPPF